MNLGDLNKKPLDLSQIEYLGISSQGVGYFALLQYLLRFTLAFASIRFSISQQRRTGARVVCPSYVDYAESTMCAYSRQTLGMWD